MYVSNCLSSRSHLGFLNNQRSIYENKDFPMGRYILCESGKTSEPPHHPNIFTLGSERLCWLLEGFAYEWNFWNKPVSVNIDRGQWHLGGETMQSLCDVCIGVLDISMEDCAPFATFAVNWAEKARVLDSSGAVLNHMLHSSINPLPSRTNCDSVCLWS